MNSIILLFSVLIDNANSFKWLFNNVSSLNFLFKLFMLHVCIIKIQ